MSNVFRFTQETLDKFDSIFQYEGTLEEGLWVYRNPFKSNESFFVQVGFGKVMFIQGWCPDGMTFQEIVNKLKNK